MINISTNNFQTANGNEYDAIIAASGFESRASFQATNFKSIPKIKYVLAFKESDSGDVRIENDKRFKGLGFSEILIDSDNEDLTIFDDLISGICKASKQDSIVRVYIDYSSMTRNWYAQILIACKKKMANTSFILTLGYTHSQYLPGSDNDILNRFVEPIHGFCSLSVPYKPTALVICLGNEKNRAYGLQEYFDAATYLMYTDKSFNPDFGEEVELVNADLLENTKPENILRFPLHDLVYTQYLLKNLCLTLLKRYRVILAPCGPKPFTLLSMITHMQLDFELEVWRISPGKGLPKIDRKPEGLVSVINLEMNRLES